jgi:hypothetical protein
MFLILFQLPFPLFDLILGRLRLIRLNLFEDQGISLISGFTLIPEAPLLAVHILTLSQYHNLLIQLLYLQPKIIVLFLTDQQRLLGLA